MTGLLLAIIYLAFISLGLPDSLLGSAWPVVYPELGVPMSWSGVVFIIIAGGTVLSSLLSDHLTRKWGAGTVTAVSVAMTAFALLGFSISHTFWKLCFFAIPYGLGAGSVDAALNNYVALHYTSRHMSWLHCMWGIGATAGPYIMSMALAAGQGWNMGYRQIGILQIVLTAILLLSLPLWNKKGYVDAETRNTSNKSMPLYKVLGLPGVKPSLLCFFCYCAIEQTVNLWASSYLVSNKGVDPITASGFACLFFIGITAGRGVSGFVTLRLTDQQLVRLGQSVIALGVLTILLPLGNTTAFIGLIAVGLGCAPIYPCLIHATPARFGAERSQSVIGTEMAAAYIGTSLMPPLFGLLANHISMTLFPWYLSVLLALMIGMHEMLNRKASKD